MKMYVRNELYVAMKNDILNNNGSNIQSIIKQYINKLVYVNNPISNSDVNTIQTSSTPPNLSSMTTTGTIINDTVTITHSQTRGYGIIGSKTFRKSDNYEIFTVYLVQETQTTSNGTTTTTDLVYGFMDIPHSAKAIGQIIFDETLTFLSRVVYIPSYQQASTMLANVPFLLTTDFAEDTSRIQIYDTIKQSYVPKYLTNITGNTPVEFITKYQKT